MKREEKKRKKFACVPQKKFVAVAKPFKFKKNEKKWSSKLKAFT